MDIEGPGGGRRALLLLLGLLHFCWALLVAFVAYIGYQLDVQGFDSPEPVHWGWIFLLLTVAAASLVAGVKLGRKQALDAYVATVTICQLALLGYWLI